MEETRWLNAPEDRAWRGYERMRIQLHARLHRSLLDATGLSLADYVVLVVLSESSEELLRAYELGAELRWEKSRLSHHLSRMEKRGLIERRKCESDARGLFVALTPEGRKAIEEAAPHHVEDVRGNFIDLLTPEELECLEEISEKVLANLSTAD